MSAPSCVRAKLCPVPGYDSNMRFRLCREVLLAIVFLFAAEFAGPAHAAAGAPENLTSAQIVVRIEQHNQAQKGELKAYKALRHYVAEYQGFSTRIEAEMDVEVNYDAATGKSFRIVSQHGSHLLCEKVLKRAVDSEKDASQDQASTA